MNSTICLNMIVKNEAKVIARAINSVRHLINYYVIVDTGSTDDTTQVIKDTMGMIPGEIHSRPFIDFGHNRTEAINLAAGKADYILVLDADDEIVGTHPGEMTYDWYEITVVDAGVKYNRTHIFKSTEPFTYKGVLHEWLDCAGLHGTFTNRLICKRHYDGASWGNGSIESLKEKYLKDAATLQNALINDPTNDRYAFYLAQSWRDAAEHDKAIEAYEHRVTMGGWDEEVWFSLYQIAKLKEKVVYKEVEIQDAYLRAFENRPSRLESLYALGSYWNTRNKYKRTYHVLKPVIDQTIPNDRLYVEPSVYSWQLKDIFAVAAHYAGDLHAARRTNEKLLQSGLLPAHEVGRVTTNLQFAAGNAEQTFIHDKIEERPVDPFFGSFFEKLRQELKDGGSEFGLGLTLFNLVVAMRCESVVEIGRFKGFSTFAIAAALKYGTEQSWQEPKRARQRPGFDYEKFERVGAVRKVYSIDPFPLPEAFELIEKNDLLKYVRFIDKRSDQVELGDFLKTPDLIFIDGDHSYEGCMADVKRFVPMLKPGGTFILHDFHGWYTKDGINQSPIRRVASEVVRSIRNIEHYIVETGYMGLIVFRAPSNNQNDNIDWNAHD